eukprot:Gb_29959 [translate_table: standard]
MIAGTCRLAMAWHVMSRRMPCPTIVDISFPPHVVLQRYQGNPYRRKVDHDLMSCVSLSGSLSRGGHMVSSVQNICHLMPLPHCFVNMLCVAVGAGWQGLVAFVNMGCCYLFGLPLGYLDWDDQRNCVANACSVCNNTPHQMEYRGFTTVQQD